MRFVNERSVLGTAILVAKAGCAKVGRAVTMGSVTTALGLLLSLGGCGQSHTNLPDLDGDGYTQADDCNDEDPTIHPGADDPACADGVDQDCDGVDGEPDLVCNWFPEEDIDGDGYPRGIDCNDNDASIHPGMPAEECCATVDQNCDGVVGPDPTEPIACNCFWDEDGDGWGTGFGPGPDCNDSDPTIHPEAPEVCGDGIDQNCDGTDIVCEDADDDGWLAGEDCDDTDPAVHPEAEEPECPDGIDQDCDGIDGDPTAWGFCAPPEDADGDGFDALSDCDDSNATVYPGAPEDICPDGIDQDCDGFDGDPAVICNGMADVEELITSEVA